LSLAEQAFHLPIMAQCCVMNEPLRDMDERERALVQEIFSRADFPDKETFLQQALSSKVQEWDDGSGTLSFEVGFGATGPHWVPVQGEYRDSDGETVNVLLHIREDRLFELEFFRDAPGPRLRLPDSGEIQLF
jgi:hypothetical protein